MFELSFGRFYFMLNYRVLFVVKKMFKNICILGLLFDWGLVVDIGVFGFEFVYMFSGRYCCMFDYFVGRLLNFNCV